MTSKSLFFKLVKENLRQRIWTFALSCIVFFLYFPVVSFAMNDYYMRNTAELAAADVLRKQQLLYEAFIEQHTMLAGPVGIIMIIFAVIMAANSFGYLHDQKKTDFFHSLPVSRTELYVVNVLNSLLITAVPYILMALISGAAVQSASAKTDCILLALACSLKSLAFFLFLYAVAAAAMILTGKTAVGTLGTFVFYLYGPLVHELFVSLKQSFLRTYYYDSDVADRFNRILSPVFWMMTSSGRQNTKEALIALGAAFVIGFLCLILYRHRSSEAAGHAMAFKRTETPIRAAITVPCAVCIGMCFYSLLNNSDAWYIFGALFGAFVVHSVINVIQHLDFRKVLSGRLSLLFCLAAGILIFVFFRFDLSGFDRYLPADGSVVSGGIYCNAVTGIYGSEDLVEKQAEENGVNAIYGYMSRSSQDIVDRMQVSDVAALKAIAQSGINHETDINSEGPYDSESMYRRVLIGWHMKSGRTIYREYSVDLKTVGPQLHAICRDEGFKNTIYPILTKTDEQVADFAGVNFKDAFGPHHVSFNGDQGDALKADIRLLWETYCEELTAMTPEERFEGAPVAALQFKSSRFQAIADQIRSTDGNLYPLNSVGYYPVFRSFKKTLALLEQDGVKLNEALSPENVSRLTISDQRTHFDENGDVIYDTDDSFLVVTDPEMIREILDSCDVIIANMTDELHAEFDGLKVTAYPDSTEENLDDEMNESVELTVNANRMPDFLKAYYGITDEELNAAKTDGTW